MSVSSRNTFLFGAVAATALVLGSAAYASGGSMSGSGGVVVPGAGSGQSSPCCNNRPSGHGVVVPGVNVAGPNVTITGSNVRVNQGSVITSTQSYLSTSVASSSSGGVYASGGGGYYAAQAVKPTSIGALNVEGGDETYFETVTEKVPTTEEYCVDQISVQKALKPVQAVCLDDKGTPHPASRIDSSQRVAPGYSGELYRCMAGTSMMVTLGSVEDGKTSFAHGQSFACQKGEALVHQPGGDLVCKPQAPQRDCNERSLLRRHGPGVKVVETSSRVSTCVPQTRTVLKTVQKQVERTRITAAKPMVFDGGVGQGVQ